LLLWDISCRGLTHQALAFLAIIQPQVLARV
jgi:hypothetical protein